MSFNIDEVTVDKEKEGVWADFKGSKLLIASSGNNKFQRLFSRLQKPHRKALDRGSLDPETQLDIMARSMAGGILLDWSNVVDGSGSIVEFSVDKAYRALKNNSVLREFVSEFATDIANYVEEEREDLGKSAGKSSDGKQSSEKE